MNQSLDLSSLHYRKAERSSAQGSNCVEVADAGQMIAVRDSKNPTGGTHTFSRRAITQLATRIRAGQYDL